MERKNSTEYSVVFLGKKFKLLRLHLCCRFRAATWVGTTLEQAVFRSGPDPKYSRASAFLFFFLSTTIVFAAVRTHYPRKTTACLVDGTAINKKPFKYNNEHILLRSGRLVEWLERSPNFRAAEIRIHEGGQSFFSFFSFLFFLFFIGNYFKK